MKAVEFNLPLAWSGQTQGVSGSSLKVDVLPKSTYRELIRHYNARLTELYTLIKNECQVLRRNGDYVLWYIAGRTDAGFEVYYAVIPRDSAVLPVSGFCFLLPETWLLCHLLADDQLYRVHGTETFWAYRKRGKGLQMVAAKGLYAQPDVFCAASGLTTVPDAANYDLHDYISAGKRSLPLLMLIGAGYKARVEHSFDLKKFTPHLKKLATVFAAYAAGLSVLLLAAESYLNRQVEILSADAAVFMEKQQGLAQKQQFIGAYQQLISAHETNAVMLRAVTAAPDLIGRLQIIQTAASRLQIQGAAKSATAVLGYFVNHPDFSEVKFDREVQMIRGEESYSISMVYSGKSEIAQQGTQHAANQ